MKKLTAYKAGKTPKPVQIAANDAARFISEGYVVRTATGRRVRINPAVASAPHPQMHPIFAQIFRSFGMGCIAAAMFLSSCDQKQEKQAHACTWESCEMAGDVQFLNRWECGEGTDCYIAQKMHFDHPTWTSEEVQASIYGWQEDVPFSEMEISDRLKYVAKLTKDAAIYKAAKAEEGGDNE